MKCENCGKEHDGSYGSGRFCSAHCRRSWIGKKSYETRIANGTYISGFTKANKNNFKTTKAPYGTWKCEYCNDHPIFETRQKLKEHKRKFHPIPKGSSWNKGLTKESDIRVLSISQTLKEKYVKGIYVSIFKGKKHSLKSRQKMSQIAKAGYKSGKRKGWQSRRITSFPEKFWRAVLDNNKIQYCINFPVSRKSLGDNSSKSYFLDFKIKNNIDLEIDGAQHRFRKEHDKKRDELLINNGYKVYRIEWNEIHSDSGKLLMKNKINAFLKWLSKQ